MGERHQGRLPVSRMRANAGSHRVWLTVASLLLALGLGLDWWSASSAVHVGDAGTRTPQPALEGSGDCGGVNRSRCGLTNGHGHGIGPAFSGGADAPSQEQQAPDQAAGDSEFLPAYAFAVEPDDSLYDVELSDSGSWHTRAHGAHYLTVFGNPFGSAAAQLPHAAD